MTLSPPAGILLGCALIALGGCSVKGEGKGSTPTWKVYRVEVPQPAPSAPLRSGSEELKITKVFLEENKTVLATSHWVARIRGTLVSPDKVPLSSLSDAFTITGKSGKSYRAHVSTVGPGRRTWQHQEHTGQPTHLPANVPGELEIWCQVGDDKTHDELEAFSFRELRVVLPR